MGEVLYKFQNIERSHYIIINMTQCHSEARQQGTDHEWAEVRGISPILCGHGTVGEGEGIQLETKVIRMFPKISQSRRRPLLGPSPG